MRILVAPNAFKGSLDAWGAAESIAEGLARGLPASETILSPVADGGDGTAAVLMRGLGGRMVACDVVDPLGRPIRAEWCALDDGTTAVIEIARASGLALLSPDEATVDGGAGLVGALGARLSDAKGSPIERGGAGLAALDRIDVSAVGAGLAGVELVAACDVDNELLGEAGAAKTFGPQKGATRETVADLERNLSHLADVIERHLGRDVRHVRHGGAAGGIAAAILGILGGKLAKGSDLVLEWLRFDELLADCDLVVTGEGFVDLQTLANKAPVAVARAARKKGIPVVLFAGGVADHVTSSTFPMFDAIVPICPRPMPLDDAMSKAREHLVFSAEQFGRIVSLRRT